mgnify:FL=1
MVAQEGIFRKGVQITDWGSRLYILDPTSDQIWRYPFVKSKSVFGTAEGYKTAGDLKNSVALTIDSSVYVLNNDGSILRLYGGVKQTLEVERASFSTASQPTRIYTDAEMSNLFVVDNSGRVFVYFKDPKTAQLIYTGQVILDGIKDIRDVSYDKSSSRLYILDAKRIYEVQL